MSKTVKDAHKDKLTYDARSSEQYANIYQLSLFVECISTLYLKIWQIIASSAG